ncbi:hypothetical protein WHR41_01704 [Cladosporium halotolerans]|uniref:Ketoreductase domain-containing protein n=1 Tax=Cladosporium halotolerans TaxID=1052096 RepID=A0AB34L178_9PEZI
MHIKDRTFIISGGASGLGLATARDLHSHGGYIAILDLNTSAGTALASSLAPRARFFETDVSSTPSLEAAVQGAAAWIQDETHAPLAAIIPAAGVGNPAKLLTRHGAPAPMAALDFVLSINLRGTLDLVRLALPLLAGNEPSGPDGERGVVVLVSSAAAYDGQPGQVAYAASKGAVRSVALPLARDLAPLGIRAVAIAPGYFESNMTAAMSEKVRGSLERVMEFPRRAGRGEEFAALVRAVVENVMLNGECVRLDGGTRMPSKL